MICKQCHQAFNGTAGICHLCGTVHSVPSAGPKPEITEEVVSEIPDAAIPEKKKKAHKK